jgi:Nucleotide modification associated domain 2
MAVIGAGFVWLVARPASLVPLALWLLGFAMLVLGVLLAILVASSSSSAISPTPRRATSSPRSRGMRQDVYRADRATELVAGGPRLYVYKLTDDHGAAPCVDEGDGLLTLAICKPMIRKTARVGDVIFGFAADSLSPDNRLIYIARVTKVEEDGDYYEKATYEHRGDRIYIRGDDGRFRLRPDAIYHTDRDHIPRDLGSFPEYERARVLLSDDFRYFGSAPGSQTPDLSRYPRLQGLLRTLSQGHRVNHAPELANELRQLLRSAWSDHSAQILGSPSPMTAGAAPNSRRSPRC